MRKKDAGCTRLTHLKNSRALGRPKHRKQKLSLFNTRHVRTHAHAGAKSDPLFIILICFGYGQVKGDKPLHSWQV
jgi:hypothetical protein